MNKKSILAYVLILVMLFSLSIPACADGTQYKTTGAFVEALNELDGVTYTVEGMTTYNDDVTNYEYLSISYTGDLSSYKSNFYALFSEDSSEVIFYMPNLLTFAEDDLFDLLVIVNELNAMSSGVKLFVDTDNYTVDAELFLLTTEESAVEIAAMGMGLLIAFTDTIFESLSDYAT